MGLTESAFVTNFQSTGWKSNGLVPCRKQPKGDTCENSVAMNVKGRRSALGDITWGGRGETLRWPFRLVQRRSVDKG